MLQRPTLTRRAFLPMLIAALGLVLAAPQARADAVDDAKAAGLIGERPDGYLGIVSESAPASVRSLVDSTNAKRRAAYAKIAAKNGTSPEAVAALAAEKLYGEASPGEYLMDGSGRWFTK